MVHEPPDYAARIIDAITGNSVFWVSISSIILLLIVGYCTHWTSDKIANSVQKLNDCKMSVFLTLGSFIVLFGVVLHKIGEPSTPDNSWLDKPIIYVWTFAIVMVVEIVIHKYMEERGK
jgi:hypothetical protein